MAACGTRAARIFSRLALSPSIGEPQTNDVFEVTVSPMRTERFRSVLAAERYEELERGVTEALELLGGRVVWNINSTARGGGVAELLESLVAYARGAGVDCRWAVIEGRPEF